MRRNHEQAGMRMRGAVLAGLGAAVMVAVFAGCGEQDLYKPPKSPYQVVARLHLPSAAEDISALGEMAYIAGGQAGLHIVDVSNPVEPRLVNTVNTNKYTVAVAAASVPTASGIADLSFLAEGTEGVAVENVSRPDSVYYTGKANTYDANGVFVEVPESPDEAYSVYVADSWRGLWVFDMAPDGPEDFSIFGRSYTLGYARGVAARSGFAYVSDDEMGLVVVDVRVRAAMQVVSAADTEGNARDIALWGEYAYIADGTRGLAIFRINGGETPVPVATLPLGGRCRAIDVRDRYAFLAAEDGGVHIVDISNPSSPVLAGTVVSAYATGVAVTKSGLVLVSDRDEGCIVLSAGGVTFADGTAPSKVADLRATPLSASAVRLDWTAPGNDLFHGTAARYDIRFAAAPITDENWLTATVCDASPLPDKAGRPQSYTVTGLELDTEYYFCLRASDEVPLWSKLSNSVVARTFAGNVAPTLAAGSVTPLGAESGSSFTFRVTYADPDNDPPSRHDLVLNGESFAMTGSGNDYIGGVIYTYDTTLESGRYSHSFAFDDGENHPVETEPADGPWIGEVVVLGSPAEEGWRDTDELQHIAVIPWAVWIDDHEVTQAEYEQTLGAGRNRSRFRAADLPVENVSWFDAIEYCNARSVAEGFTPAYTIHGQTVVWNPDADGYRLPTEAEWERACRSGSTTAFAGGDITVGNCLASGNPDPVLDLYGWYCGNAGATTHAVKGKQANAGGYYDMHGNVWEWCWDWYSTSGVVGDPTGPDTGAQRVIRGGSWYYYASDCRSASRAPYWPNSRDDVVGFRVARTLP